MTLAQRKPLFLAVNSIFQTPILATVGMDFEVHALFIGKTVGLVLWFGVAGFRIFQRHEGISDAGGTKNASFFYAPNCAPWLGALSRDVMQCPDTTFWAEVLCLLVF